MKVYGVHLSVHVRKVLWAARLKGVEHEVVPVVPVVPQNLPENWSEISPTGLIPAIEDRGFRLADSSAIVHYLERIATGPKLLPTDDKDHARALFLDAWAGGALFRAVIHPVFHNRVVNPAIRGLPSDEAAVETALTVAAPKAFAWLETLLSSRFLVGEALSIADMAVVSNLVMFHYLGQTPGSLYPKIEAYFGEWLADPILGAVLDAERPFVERMGLDTGILDRG